MLSDFDSKKLVQSVVNLKRMEEEKEKYNNNYQH